MPVVEPEGGALRTGSDRAHRGVPRLTARHGSCCRWPADSCVTLSIHASRRSPGRLTRAPNEIMTFGLRRKRTLSPSVPTLFISAEDDLYGTLANARQAAKLIPNAKLI